MWTKNWKALPVVALAALTLLPACGKKSFKPLDKTTSGVAGQYLVIKPKLDLVIFQDNSDSLANTMGQLKPQMVNLLSSLDTNWEYRVIVLPLLSNQNMSVKKVLSVDCASVAGFGCYSPSQINQFNSLGGDQGWITSRANNGNEDLGFYYMKQNLNALAGTSFLRNDASLVVMVISNGEDSSGGVDYTVRPDGATTLGSINYNGAQTIASYNSYKNQLQAILDANSMNYRLYAIVAQQQLSSCNGDGLARAGIRYMTLAGELGGTSFNLCSGGISTAVNELRSNLIPMVQEIVFNYIVLPEEPDTNQPMSFKKNGQEIPNSASNGWTYAGKLVNQPTSYLPALGNVRTGFMIRLDGTAELKGTDTYSVTYVKK